MRVNIEHVENKLVLRLTGRFDGTASNSFREAYTPGLTAEDVHDFEIDLSEVEFVDCTALGTLLILRQKAQAAHKTVTLTNSPPFVNRITRLVSVDRLFTHS